MSIELKDAIDKTVKDFDSKTFENMKSLFACKSCPEFCVEVAALGMKKLNQNCTFALVLMLAAYKKHWIIDYVKDNIKKKDCILTIGKKFATNTMKLHQAMVQSDHGRLSFHILFEVSFYGYWIFQAPS